MGGLDTDRTIYKQRGLRRNQTLDLSVSLWYRELPAHTVMEQNQIHKGRQLGWLQELAWPTLATVSPQQQRQQGVQEAKLHSRALIRRLCLYLSH